MFPLLLLELQGKTADPRCREPAYKKVETLEYNFVF